MIDKSRIQSCVDHINTAVDVDPWAKELVAEMGKEILEQLNNSNQEVKKTSDADRILKILESAKDKNADVPMSIVRKAFDKLLQSVQPQYTELTPEEAASEIASGSIMSVSYWLDLMIRLKQMGYAICRKKG